MPPSTILAAISSFLPLSIACSMRNFRSFSTISAGMSSGEMPRGLGTTAVMCMQTWRRTSSGAPAVAWMSTAVLPSWWTYELKLSPLAFSILWIRPIEAFSPVEMRMSSMMAVISSVGVTLPAG